MNAKIGPMHHSRYWALGSLKIYSEFEIVVFNTSIQEIRKINEDKIAQDERAGI